jgi:anti-sigma B factor antagonist
MSDLKPIPDEAPFRIDVDRRGQSVIARLVGSAHMTAATDLGQRLTGLVDQKTRTLVLDLAHLVFISSIGLSGIITAQRECLDRNVELRLAQPGPHLRSVLNVTRFDTVLPVYETVEQAIPQE